MKKYLIKTFFIAICVLASSLALPTTTQAEEQVSTLHVTGYAKEQVSPDTAIITVGIETTAPEATDARTQNNVIMQRINNSIRALGVDRLDMRTMSFNLQPNYAPKGHKIVSYTVTNSMQIKVRDFNLISQIINEAGNAGASQIYGVRFSNEHSDVIKDRLISQAVANGKTAAQSAAAAAGITLGKVKEININGSSPSYAENYPVLSMRAMKVDSTPIEPGTNTMSASVELTFYLY